MSNKIFVNFETEPGFQQLELRAFLFSPFSAKPMDTKEAPQGLLEVLTSIRSITANNKIVSSLARIMWRLFELICYLLAVLILLFAFVYVTPRVEIVKTEEITVTVSNENTTAIVYAIRFFLTLMSIFLLIPAWLIRIIRKKNKRIEAVDYLVAGHMAKIKENRREKF